MATLNNILLGYNFCEISVKDSSAFFNWIFDKTEHGHVADIFHAATENIMKVDWMKLKDLVFLCRSFKYCECYKVFFIRLSCLYCMSYERSSNSHFSPAYSIGENELENSYGKTASSSAHITLTAELHPKSFPWRVLIIAFSSLWLCHFEAVVA